VSRRAGLWIAFVIVHLAVAASGFVFPNQPMGDVHNVYDPWSTWAIEGQAIVGITEPWVYPQLALIPMVLAQGLSWIVDYQVAWAILVTLADALAFAMLVGRGRSRGRRTAAWFWLAFILLLGPVGIYRLDGLTVPLALAGSLWLVGRPWLGSILLAVAMWIKVWPVALLAAAVLAARRRWAVVGGALVISGLTLAAVFAAGAGGHAFGFITDQTDRGLQLEAPVSAWWLWRAVLGIRDSAIFYDHDMLTFEVTGPGVEVVSAIMTPLLVLGAAAVAALGAYRAWRGATFLWLFPPLSLAFVLVLIVFNKVGSPQYMCWLIAPLAVGLVIDRRRWWGPAVLGLGMALITQIVYPLLYGGLLSAGGLPAALLTVRNALVAVLLVWVVVRLARLPHRAPTLVRPAPAQP
jgi:hypothetical protein